MIKIGLVIFVLFIGILFGSILQEQVCGITKTEYLGTGKPIAELTCKILSIPIEIILLIIAIVGSVIYYIKTNGG